MSCYNKECSGVASCGFSVGKVLVNFQRTMVPVKSLSSKVKQTITKWKKTLAKSVQDIQSELGKLMNIEQLLPGDFTDCISEITDKSKEIIDNFNIFIQNIATSAEQMEKSITTKVNSEAEQITQKFDSSSKEITNTISGIKMQINSQHKIFDDALQQLQNEFNENIVQRLDQLSNTLQQYNSQQTDEIKATQNTLTNLNKQILTQSSEWTKLDARYSNVQNTINEYKLQLASINEQIQSKHNRAISDIQSQQLYDSISHQSTMFDQIKNQKLSQIQEQVLAQIRQINQTLEQYKQQFSDFLNKSDYSDIVCRLQQDVQHMQNKGEDQNVHQQHTINFRIKQEVQKDKDNMQSINPSQIKQLITSLDDSQQTVIASNQIKRNIDKILDKELKNDVYDELETYLKDYQQYANLIQKCRTIDPTIHKVDQDIIQLVKSAEQVEAKNEQINAMLNELCSLKQQITNDTNRMQDLQQIIQSDQSTLQNYNKVSTLFMKMQLAKEFSEFIANKKKQQAHGNL